MVAALVLSDPQTQQPETGAVGDGAVHELVHNTRETPQENEEPADPERFRRSAGSSSCSGGRI